MTADLKGMLVAGEPVHTHAVLSSPNAAAPATDFVNTGDSSSQGFSVSYCISCCA